MQRELHDHWFREAKRNGYRSRAAYKLIEIDDKRKLLKRGMAVLDCGAAPGSWLQVASQRIGDTGVVVGVDLSRIDGGLPANARVFEGDLASFDAETLRDAAGGRDFDVVLSDMAPATTGDRTIDHHGSIRLCHLVLDLARKVLAERGAVVMKVLEGEAYPELLERTGAMFERVKGFKPKASRAVSTEMFVIATGRLALVDEETADMPLPPKRPSGWGA